MTKTPPRLSSEERQKRIWPFTGQMPFAAPTLKERLNKAAMSMDIYGDWRGLLREAVAALTALEQKNERLDYEAVDVEETYSILVASLRARLAQAEKVTAHIELQSDNQPGDIG